MTLTFWFQLKFQAALNRFDKSSARKECLAVVGLIENGWPHKSKVSVQGRFSAGPVFVQELFYPYSTADNGLLGYSNIYLRE